MVYVCVNVLSTSDIFYSSIRIMIIIIKYMFGDTKRGRKKVTTCRKFFMWMTHIAHAHTNEHTHANTFKSNKQQH